MPHLMLAPIALPMFTAALLLLLREEQQRLKFGVSLVSTLVGLLVSIALLQWVLGILLAGVLSLVLNSFSERRTSDESHSFHSRPLRLSW